MSHYSIYLTPIAGVDIEQRVSMKISQIAVNLLLGEVNLLLGEGEMDMHGRKGHTGGIWFQGGSEDLLIYNQQTNDYTIKKIHVFVSPPEKAQKKHLCENSHQRNHLLRKLAIRSTVLQQLLMKESRHPRPFLPCPQDFPLSPLTYFPLGNTATVAILLHV